MTTTLQNHDLTANAPSPRLHVPTKYPLRLAVLLAVAFVLGSALILTGFMSQPEPQPIVTVTWDLQTKDGYVEHVSVTGPPDVAERTMRQIVERGNPTEVR